MEKRHKIIAIFIAVATLSCFFVVQSNKHGKKEAERVKQFRTRNVVTEQEIISDLISRGVIISPYYDPKLSREQNAIVNYYKSLTPRELEIVTEKIIQQSQR